MQIFTETLKTVVYWLKNLNFKDMNKEIEAIVNEC